MAVSHSAMALRCERCGGTSFSNEDDALRAVCAECGLESADTLNALKNGVCCKF